MKNNSNNLQQQQQQQQQQQNQQDSGWFEFIYLFEKKFIILLNKNIYLK